MRVADETSKEAGGATAGPSPSSEADLDPGVLLWRPKR